MSKSIDDYLQAINELQMCVQTELWSLADQMRAQEQENAKLKRLLATACYLLEHTYNDIPTTIRDNNELKQWYEEHKKENK
jgi:hypothetical protein